MSLLHAISVSDIRARGTICEADVLALRRAFNEDGVIDSTEAEALFGLHRACSQQDATWADCFVEMLTEHVVNQAKPEGYVTAEKADWLLANISVDGIIGSRTEFELLVTILDKARWSPQGLVAFALDQIKRAVIDGAGPLRAGKGLEAGVIDEAEVELLKRILYAFGGDGNIAITRPEAEALFAIDAATIGKINAESWPDLFVKAIANCVMAASGYATPSREQALARETWLERRGDLSLGAVINGMANGILGGLLSAYRQQSGIERAIATLERQKVEIVTAQEIEVADAAWLAECIGRDGSISPNESALVAFLEANNAIIAPELSTLLARLRPAA